MELRVDDSGGDRLDAWLAARLPDLSRSRIQALIREQFIVVNGQPAKPRDAVKPGAVISIAIPEAVPDVAAPQDIPLSILFEDDDLVVLDKEAGIVVHPAAGNPDGTLVNALLHHCKGQLSGIGGVERPGIVHRLDKDTSGCLVVAKTDHAHQSLTNQFSGRTMEKIYLAVTQGIPKPEKDTIFTHIGRHPVNRQKMAVVNPPGGKPAITDYEIRYIDPSTLTALVKVHLHTGRTHQIRVHMLHKGTPLLGDPIYAKPARQSGYAGRLMLHAWKLEFDHPRTNKRLAFQAPIPPEFTPWVQGVDLDGAM
ncbi:RluA family pseudouridine synthase [Luteolibacter ambystomatis]|uniref:Pseudouridine synthase n=1 Tax=Luteolibacter ambystomatis TaxID=2824561 RepID=A0A975J2T4_9BACT|nr:RluA family pseudouridine synthase [Luteolibacter ambystomatis]QUE53008.1 RluA family pseudouridine synthase [Luteolibacter ambystomatis]